MPTLVGYRHLRVCGKTSRCRTFRKPSQSASLTALPKGEPLEDRKIHHTKAPCKYCHPERSVVAYEVCINPRFLTPHRNIPRGLNDRVPQAETEYFQGVKDLRIGSHILPFKPILLHGIFDCLEILRLRAKPFAQDDTLIIFVHRRIPANSVQTGDS